MSAPKLPAHTTPGPQFPPVRPVGFPANKEDIVFDPLVHLQLEPLRYVKTLRGTDVPFPVPVRRTEQAARTAEDGFPGLAYSAPFRVLSDEGVRALRRCIDQNEEHATSVPSRVPKCLRGLGYRSKFIHDLGYSPEVLRHLSGASGIEVTPHSMGSNLAQTNFGEIGTGSKVDQWHLDSVPYVMVLLCSDATDMVGGELKVARIPGSQGGESDPATTLDLIKRDEIPEAFIDTVNYKGAGYAIFMQGSRIAHSVTAVTAAREPRITLVNSYQSCNPFTPDSTVFRTFQTMKDGEGEDRAPYEFARHVAWRVSGQMGYLLNEDSMFGGERRGDVTAVLDRAAAELARARDLISGKAVEEAVYATEGEASQQAGRAIKMYEEKKKKAQRAGGTITANTKKELPRKHTSRL